ncbi:hypothetical protein C5S29_14290 [ANME-1 cluster archaeon GoMg3.2]|nr:hypothetical protein [ANME-1 cluster archaeon GoMg3.2]
MKIVLINPRLRAWSPNIWVPLGLAYIAAVLEKEGHTVKIIDMNEKKLNDDDLRANLKEDVDVVGITGMITEYKKILRIIDIAKDGFTDRKVILGGPLATTLPQQLLEQSKADFIVIGEGENTAPILIQAIEQGSDLAEIRGIAYKKGEQIVIDEPVRPIDNLDTIPFPARHLLDMDKYIRDHFESYGWKIEGYDKIRSTNLTSSRGCPYNCTFCFKGMWGYKWRGRSAENVIAEMELLNEKYGVNGFMFSDDTFVLDKKRVFEFTKLLKRSGLDAVWDCNGRINLMQKDMLKAMHDAGCVSIAYGIESGNQSILDSMRKNITIEQTKKVVKWTKEIGIKAAGFFMIGMLGETKEKIMDTLNFAKELDLDFYGFSIATPLPGTELYREVIKKGLIQTDMTSLKEWDFDININLTEDCTDSDLRAFKYEAFKEFTLKKQFGKCYMINPTFLREGLKVVLSLRNREEAKEVAKNVRGIIKSYLNLNMRKTAREEMLK